MKATPIGLYIALVGVVVGGIVKAVSPIILITNVPALFIVADEAVVLPLESMHELYGRTSDPKRMVVIERADHMHFCDRAAEIHEIFRSMPPPGVFENAARRTLNIPHPFDSFPKNSVFAQAAQKGPDARRRHPSSGWVPGAE